MSIQKELFEHDIDDHVIICRPWITLRNGKRLYAWQVGKKAFCFPAKRR
ncbi:hypothetical protein [Limnobacter litoralis]|nr:hypothetical protein [Limnobacter litoralis]